MCNFFETEKMSFQDFIIIFNNFFEEKKIDQESKMDECPCGLTYETLMQAPNLSLGPGMICTAYGPDNQPCGRRLADHPREQQIQQQNPPSK